MTVGQIIADPNNYKNRKHVGLDISENVKNITKMSEKHYQKPPGFENIKKIIHPNVNDFLHKSILTLHFNIYFLNKIHQNISADIIDHEFDNLLFDLNQRGIVVGSCYFDINESKESVIVVTISIEHIA